MSEILTEVDTFDSDIVIPNGDDWMDDAADVVARMASKLTNRTRFLVEHTGLLAGDQTWAGANFFTNPVVAPANTNADPTKGFRYPTPVARTTPIPLGTLYGPTQINNVGHIGHRTTGADWPAIWIPIRIPMYCAFHTVSVRMIQAQAALEGPDTFQLYKRNGNTGWIAQGSAEALMSGATGLGDEHEATVSLHTASTQLVHDDEEWAYQWAWPFIHASSAPNRIVGISVDWLDYGPNNRIG